MFTKVFPNLELISAFDCSLNQIELNNFKKLFSLKMLALQENQIDLIHEDTFQDSFNLEVLKLQSIKIKFIHPKKLFKQFKNENNSIEIKYVH